MSEIAKLKREMDGLTLNGEVVKVEEVMMEGIAAALEVLTAAVKMNTSTASLHNQAFVRIWDRLNRLEESG